MSPPVDATMTHPPVPVVKVVVSGPFGAGKTTFVASASGDTALGSESDVTDSTAALKDQTTVAMDHASVVGPSNQYMVTLFGTPGQERFTFMWPLLAQGMHAYLLLVDASRLQSMAQLKGVIKHFANFAPESPFLIAPNRWDSDEVPLDELAEFLDVDPNVIVECDPRDPAQCRALLEQLVHVSGALDKAKVPE